MLNRRRSNHLWQRAAPTARQVGCPQAGQRQLGCGLMQQGCQLCRFILMLPQPAEASWRQVLHGEATKGVGSITTAGRGTSGWRLPGGSCGGKPGVRKQRPSAKGWLLEHLV